MKINCDLLDDCRTTSGIDTLTVDHLPTGVFIRVPNLRSQSKTLACALDVLQHALNQFNKQKGE